MSFKPDILDTPVYKSKPMISKQYTKESEVKEGNIFDNKEALVLAVRLKALWKLEGGVNSLQGTNLLVVGMDGNNQIVLIAFPICKGETGPCWTWWMSVLKECIGDNPNLLFISDRHPAIALALQNEFPLAFHSVPRVPVTCRSRKMMSVGNENENIPLYYHIVNNLQIQFGREELCLVIGLRFAVEYWADYDNEEDHIPFRRRVFPSSLDGEHITRKNVETLIDSKLFDRLHDDDAVSLCCVGILQLVFLGVEGRRIVPDWI
nr:transposase, MuDR, MULE transposase domain protein [Tanacetum cinerariifolium]